MADITITRKHAFDATNAAEKLRTLVTNFQEKRPDQVKDVSFSEDGTSATASGRFFKGTFNVTDEQVSVDIDLIGFAAKMAKGMVQQQITKALDSEFPA
jgi:hypothetical protein